MRILNSLCIAFSMYSKLPVPKVSWDEKNMKYSMCFFPLIGIAVGGCLLLWMRVAHMFLVPEGFTKVMCVVIPVWITGGIHLDGFIDTSDARASYGDREKKLLILKDSHVGAFAIISCCIYFLLSFGAWLGIEGRMVPMIAIGYILTRALSGLAVAVFPLAKDSGLVAMFSNAAQKRTVCITMLVYIVLACVCIVYSGGIVGFCVIAAVFLVYLYYYVMSKREFGGITGDLAGYFVQVAELAILIVLVLGTHCIA